MLTERKPGPLTLRPILVERIWGEQNLTPWYPQPSPGKPIGEVWLTAEECLIEGTDTSLGQLAKSEFAALGTAREQGFPLLIKLLFPREKLSVQVHPNDEQAFSTLGQPRGKTECWYVLSAAPGAQVAVGFAEPMGEQNIRRSIEDGTIEQRLRYIDVKAGDMVFVDAGTVHAIGPGMVVLETQQYSDVTYRLWDYGRPRELHLDAGLAVARSTTAAGLVEPVTMGDFRRLVSCAFFKVDSFQLSVNRSIPLGARGNMQILIALGGGAAVHSGDAEFPLKPGFAVLLPAEEREFSLHTSAAVEVIRVLGAEAS